MWTKDEEDEEDELMWWDEEDEQEPTEEEQVEEFFEKFGLETIVQKDLGYDCFAEVTVNELYNMIMLRLKFEEQE